MVDEFAGPYRGSLRPELLVAVLRLCSKSQLSVDFFEKPRPMMSFEGAGVLSSASDTSGACGTGSGVVDLPFKMSCSFPDNVRFTGSGGTITFSGIVDAEPVLIALMWLISASRLGRSAGFLWYIK